VRWVRGAIGPAKQALFQEADIFVFPTRYAVEAQPLVLLEAMASACAIVTTRAGEIATILDDQSAVFLEGSRVDSLALALNRLSADLPECRRLATEARSRFVANFQLDRQIDRWEEIIGGAQK
jgi:glycosyltransferase involved in cell wall biosynthesis